MPCLDVSSITILCALPTATSKAGIEPLQVLGLTFFKSPWLDLIVSLGVYSNCA